MSSKWAEAGILRKKQTKENFDDLLVFGYACKLFRDDDRALCIDQGKHLIPWMGDDRLRIDRYDGRGALCDLASCEASKEGYDVTKWLGCSDAERKIEQMCDEERYYFLNVNEDDEVLYKEEEAKRQKATEFQYTYDVQPEMPITDDNSQEEIVSTCEEENKVFVPSASLNVPTNIELPKTIRENARIEKTALFVSEQGPQMEILIKAKQSSNAHFSFLNKDDPLQKYYRHLINSIKSGQYKPENVADTMDNTTTESSNASGLEHYLHPTLATPPVTVQSPQPVMAMVPAPIIPYKPTADCAYTQLVSRIKGTTGSTFEKVDEAPIAHDAPSQQGQEMFEQYYQAQYYQYYQQIAQQYAIQRNCDINVILQNIQMQEQIQQQAAQYAQAVCANYSVGVTEEVESRDVNSCTDTMKPTIAKSPLENSEQKLSLVQYSSDSDDETEEAPNDKKSTFLIPPKDISVIIDKMATYVAKNGLSFEQSVKEKGDPRFDFLSDFHNYHKYYEFKVNEFSIKAGGKPLKIENIDAERRQHTDNERKVLLEEKKKLDKSRGRETKIVAAVSFSIKKSKDDSPKDMKFNALPIEESDDDNHRIPLPVLTPALSPNPSAALADQAHVNHQTKQIPEEGSSFNGHRQEDLVVEMIDLTQENNLEKLNGAKRLAHERIKSKLALAVRERSLQMERKKRAVLFLKMQSERYPGTKDPDQRAEDCNSSLSASDLEDGELKKKSKRSDKERRSKYSHKSSRLSRHKSHSHDSKSRHRKSKKRRYSRSFSKTSSDSN